MNMYYKIEDRRCVARNIHDYIVLHVRSVHIASVIVLYFRENKT